MSNWFKLYQDRVTHLFPFRILKKSPSILPKKVGIIFKPDPSPSTPSPRFQLSLLMFNFNQEYDRHPH